MARCGECRFWPSYDGEGIHSADRSDCRRHAPVRADSRYTAGSSGDPGWPHPYRQHGCGDFEKLAEPEAR